MQHVGILGGGGWGTALAIALAKKNVDVQVWVREPDLAQVMVQTRENPTYLPGVEIPPGVRVTSDLGEVAKEHALILLAVPTQVIRSVVGSISSWHPQAIVAHCAKGIEQGSLLRVSQVLKDQLPARVPIAVISGPTHAEEVARQVPTAAVIASEDQAAAQTIQEVLMSPFFRLYTHGDVVGVELGGALKNVVALGTGISDGLGFGDNTRGALITRGLAEIARLGLVMGANPLTFAGLSGMGDLIATCTSQHSRNRWAGEELAKGRSLEEIIGGTKMVIEGAATALSASQLAKKMGIEMPIVEHVSAVLYEGLSPREAVRTLMEREATREVNYLQAEDLVSALQIQ